MAIIKMSPTAKVRFIATSIAPGFTLPKLPRRGTRSGAVAFQKIVSARKAGFHALVERNGVEALELAKRENVCAIISDVAMPGPVNGFELARRLESDSLHVGIILLSGVIEPADYHLPRGVRFMPKPVKTTTLLRIVREVADPNTTQPAG